MTADLVDLVTAAVVDRETRVRQGKVVSIQSGPPRSLTVNISGTSYSGIRIMDHVSPRVDEGIWMLDMGIGRWLAFGTNSGLDGLAWSDWTPTVTGTGGVVVATGAGRFVRSGFTITWSASIQITAISVAGYTNFTLPPGTTSAQVHVGTGRETATTGNLFSVVGAGTTVQCIMYNNGQTSIAGYNLQCGGSFESST